MGEGLSAEGSHRERAEPLKGLASNPGWAGGWLSDTKGRRRPYSGQPRGWGWGGSIFWGSSGWVGTLGGDRHRMAWDVSMGDRGQSSV